MKKRPPVKLAPRVVRQETCSICGDSAGHALDRPLRKLAVWFCDYHWARLPETQAMIASRIFEMGVDNVDRQKP